MTKHLSSLTASRLTRASLALSATLAPAAVFAVNLVDQAVLEYDQLMKNYNLITRGDASFTGSSSHIDSGIAIGGNLTIGGGNGPVNSQSISFSGASLYVDGGLTVNSQNPVNVKGDISAPNVNTVNPGRWSWNQNDRKLVSSTGTLFVNTAPAVNPLTNDLNWDFNQIDTRMGLISQTLNNAPTNGFASVSQGGNLQFSANIPSTHGVILIDLDMGLFAGNKYDGKTFNDISFNINANQVFVINVLNANGKSLFGSNFNNLPGTAENRLLWNFVGSGSATVNDFYGSILAADFNLSNGPSATPNGQIYAQSYRHADDELHFVPFTPPELPEPSTYGMIAVGALAGLVGFRRWQAGRRR